MPTGGAFEHPRQEGLNSVDYSVQVDAHHPVPIFVAQAGNVCGSGDAGVVAQNRDRPEARFGSAPRPPVGFASSVLAAAKAALSISASASLAPDRPNARAMPRPIPRAPPVMKAVFPSIRSIFPTSNLTEISSLR